MRNAFAVARAFLGFWPQCLHQCTVRHYHSLSVSTAATAKLTQRQSSSSLPEGRDQAVIPLLCLLQHQVGERLAAWSSWQHTVQPGRARVAQFASQSSRNRTHSLGPISFSDHYSIISGASWNRCKR